MIFQYCMDLRVKRPLWHQKLLFKKLEMHNSLNSSLIVVLFLLFLPKISAQNFTVSGTLKDASNGEDLIGATVLVKDKPGTGAAANTYGFYSLTLPKGEYTLLFSYLGLESSEQKITLDRDLRLDKELAKGEKIMGRLDDFNRIAAPFRGFFRAAMERRGERRRGAPEALDAA